MGSRSCWRRSPRSGLAGTRRHHAMTCHAGRQAGGCHGPARPNPLRQDEEGMFFPERKNQRTFPIELRSRPCASSLMSKVFLPLLLQKRRILLACPKQRAGTRSTAAPGRGPEKRGTRTRDAPRLLRHASGKVRRRPGFASWSLHGTRRLSRGGDPGNATAEHDGRCAAGPAVPWATHQLSGHAAARAGRSGWPRVRDDGHLIQEWRGRMVSR